MSQLVRTVTLANGTQVAVGAGWAVTTLPGGQQVHAHPNPQSPPMAEQLGYGTDVAAMTEDHDLLHSLLMDWLGQPASYSLLTAAGQQVHPPELAWLEEAAVLALQRLIRALPGPIQPR